MREAKQTETAALLRTTAKHGAQSERAFSSQGNVPHTTDHRDVGIGELDNLAQSAGYHPRLEQLGEAVGRATFVYRDGGEWIERLPHRGERGGWNAEGLDRRLALDGFGERSCQGGWHGLAEAEYVAGHRTAQEDAWGGA